RGAAQQIREGGVVKTLWCGLRGHARHPHCGAPPGPLSVGRQERRARGERVAAARAVGGACRLTSLRAQQARGGIWCQQGAARGWGGGQGRRAKDCAEPGIRDDSDRGGAQVPSAHGGRGKAVEGGGARDGGGAHAVVPRVFRRGQQVPRSGAAPGRVVHKRRARQLGRLRCSQADAYLEVEVPTWRPCWCQ
ncbi:hypothetical protein T484DRAFT_1896701, partial [Baffinella frigidus]